MAGVHRGRGWVACYVQDNPPTGVYRICVEFKGHPRKLWKSGAILSGMRCIFLAYLLPVLDFRTGVLGQVKSAIARAVPIPTNAVGDKWIGKKHCL